MAYAQINFKQKVGNSNLGIDEAGCFIDADANLLEKVNIHVDPPTLNTFYTQRQLYTYDLTDKANDDITWSTVTKYCPQLVVQQIGYSGWPNSDLAPVEFRYKDHLGQEVTHFCAVNHAADHSIIDSWDGKVKTPDQYEHVYGQPIAWATFIYHTPQTTPASAPAAPVSAPAAHTPTPQPVPQAPKKLYLPPSVWIWHIYKPEGPYTLPYALKNTLNPKMFGGLTYDILGNPAPHVYLIQTKNFGKVAIYAGPDTVAQFPGTGHGEGESIPVSEVVPAAVSAPAAPSEQAVPSITYTRFDQPLNLVTKEGAKSYNFALAMAVENYQPGTPFEAVGKATLPNNDTYYMDAQNFSADNEAQRQPVGIKTVDLSPAPQQSDSGVSATASNVPVAVSATAPETFTASSTTAVSAEPSESTPLWQRTFQPYTPSIRFAKQATAVYDFPSGATVKQLGPGAEGKIAGEFSFAGVKYFRTKSSYDEGTWQGIPALDLTSNANDVPYNTNDDINQLGNEALDIQQQAITKKKNAQLRAGGTLDGFIDRLRGQRSNA